MLDSPRYICCEKYLEPSWLLTLEITALNAPFDIHFSSVSFQLGVASVTGKNLDSLEKIGALA